MKLRPIRARDRPDLVRHTIVGRLHEPALCSFAVVAPGMGCAVHQEIKAAKGVLFVPPSVPDEWSTVQTSAWMSN